MTDDNTPESEKPSGVNYESPWHKAMRYALMPVTVPIMIVGFIGMAIKYSITGNSDGNGPP